MRFQQLCSAWCIVATVLLTTARGAMPQRDCDILVYGGTSGGVAAAGHAARSGKDVLPVEAGKHLGGMTSGGLGWADLGTPGTIGWAARAYFQRAFADYRSEFASR